MSNKIAIASLASLLAVAASPASADNMRALGNGWNIFTNEDDCAVTTTFVGNSMIRVAYDPARNDADVSIADPAFKSIVEGKSYKLRLSVVKSGKLDDGWGDVDATGFSLSEMNGFSFRLNGRQFLADFRAASVLALWRGDVLVTSLTMKGSAVAATALEACAWKVQKARPIDPFKD